MSKTEIYPGNPKRFHRQSSCIQYQSGKTFSCFPFRWQHSMDNHYAEQAIRPFTLGRKNFVLIESSNGAKSSTVLYSLVETAKANGLNTFEYFNLLLTEIPQHVDDNNLRFLDNLLPWAPLVQKTCPSKYKKS